MQKEQGRQKLIEAAREGNQEAIDSLTIDDMNLSNKVGRLLNSCDIYTMVESSIMPCGMESDRYTIIGEILNVVPLVNLYTRFGEPFRADGRADGRTAF